MADQSPMPTPSQLFGDAKSAANRRNAQMEQAFNDGVLEGRSQAREEFLTWLQKQYMDPANPRGGAIAQALLRVAKDCAEYFTGTATQRSKAAAKKVSKTK